LRRAKLAAKAIGFDFAALSGWRAAQWVDDWIGAADLVIIDAPPHPETEARIAVRVARLVVVPVQPFPLDPVGDGGNTQNRARRGLIVVVNLVPPRSRLTECIGADFASTGTPIAATWIGNRVASAQAVALGLGVTKTPYDPRSAEISALAEEIPGALLGFEPRLERQENSADPMGYRFLPARNRKFESISLQQTVCLSPGAAFEGREPGFPRGFGQLACQPVNRDSLGVSISRQPGAISLSGHNPIPRYGWSWRQA
jgi:chromosome partitioning protein